MDKEPKKQDETDEDGDVITEDEEEDDDGEDVNEDTEFEPQQPNN